MQMEQDRCLDRILWCENISKQFVTKRGTSIVIGDVSLSVRKNEFVVLFGPGQCGKTTMLNILSGLEQPTEGRSYVNGKQVKTPGPDRGGNLSVNCALSMAYSNGKC